MEPFWKGRVPEMVWRRDDFPTPEGPSMATNFGEGTEKERSERMGVLLMCREMLSTWTERGCVIGVNPE
jgi:hypothetical protein